MTRKKLKGCDKHPDAKPLTYARCPACQRTQLEAPPVKPTVWMVKTFPVIFGG